MKRQAGICYRYVITYVTDGFSDSLSNWIYRTIENQDPKDIEAIRSLWDNESWESIQAKLETEGSTWVVWWYDGVKKYMGLYEDENPSILQL